MEDREKAQGKFRKVIAGRLLFNLYLLQNLPVALFSGLRIRELTKEKAVVSIPYKWITKNPFRSVYFASQSMAAEMSTGALAMYATQGYDPKISMLVLNLKSEFLKKATSRIYFTCENGKEIFEAVNKAANSNEATTIEAQSTGRMADGTVVSNFFITWTFKARTNSSK